MTRIFLIAACSCLLAATSIQPVCAQQGPSTYADGDSLAALVKMNYVYSFEEALAKARQTGKPIFFNCFADWARPCHGMNGQVFSNQAFCNWMDKNFVCLFVDVTKPDNRHLAQRYGVSTFAHYLVLNADGEVVHRIVGGATLPDFQDRVALALNPKTSLRGTREAYDKGDRSKKTPHSTWHRRTASSTLSQPLTPANCSPRTMHARRTGSLLARTYILLTTPYSNTSWPIAPPSTRASDLTRWMS